MPFFFLGLVIFIAGIYFNIAARKGGDKDGVVGTTAMIIAGLILMIIFGLFFRGILTS